MSPVQWAVVPRNNNERKKDMKAGDGTDSAVPPDCRREETCRATWQNRPPCLEGKACYWPSNGSYCECPSHSKVTGAVAAGLRLHNSGETHLPSGGCGVSQRGS